MRPNSISTSSWLSYAGKPARIKWTRLFALSSRAVGPATEVVDFKACYGRNSRHFFQRIQTKATDLDLMDHLRANRAL